MIFRIGAAAVLLSATAAAATAAGQARTSPWKSAYVNTGGIRIHYWRTGAGSGKPVMVLSHGITDNGLCWTAVARKLESDYDLVLYDARGHGLSDKPETGYTLDDHVADLVGLIRRLGVKKPILMGHSMGGAIVASAAARYPDLPRAVILIDPVFLHGRPADPAKTAAGFRKWLESLKLKSREQLVALARKENPQWPEAEYGPWAESKLQVSLNILQTLGSLPDLRELFPKITAPALILKADADAAGRKENQKVAALLPRGKLVHVAGAGHSVHRDRPAETMRVLKQFLAGLPPL